MQERGTGQPPNKPRVPVERRKRKDWVTRTVTIASVISWAVAAVMLFILDRAKPSGANFFTRIFGASVRTGWKPGMLRVVLVLLILVFVLCVVGFVFNMLRHRRKTDKFSKSIMVLGCLSLAGIVLFLVYFGNRL